jgi:hypothetical protein
VFIRIYSRQSKNSQEIIVKKFKLGLVAAAMAAGFAGAANASVDNIAGGRLFYNANTSDSYLTPGLNLAGATTANYVIFSVADLADSLGGVVAAGATLTFNGPGTLSTVNQDFSLWSFEGDSSLLLNESQLAAANNGAAYRDAVITANAPAWLSDLQSGTSYGSAALTGGFAFSMDLNLDGVAAINAAMSAGDEYFVIGGFAPELYAFLGTPGGLGAASLDLAPVPVPAAVWLLGSALAGLGMLRRRNQTA